MGEGLYIPCLKTGVLRPSPLPIPINQITMALGTILRGAILQVATRQDTNSRDIAPGATYRGGIGGRGDILGPGDSGGSGGTESPS